ncbi:ubiquinone biosynthesis O-methyltransferase mitochondrial [Biomphalaria pfeifferi]|uniref:Ubiquinone biosynthesis O-methyltransferase, mitochondrial n=1 Tax=Biomphalaria pfeifferi TaxID=112525 RepID=A0AAD8BDZ9_BIOPF|nr:ubiquinone biosynthesis O-methyltransferase mitochondrial [Biomphalaria pfeifferi]
MIVQRIINISRLGNNVYKLSVICSSRYNNNYNSTTERRPHHDLVFNRLYRVQIGCQYHTKTKSDCHIQTSLIIDIKIIDCAISLTQFRHYSSSQKTEKIDENAPKNQRPKAQTTIDEEEVNKFASQSSLWWDEGGEFEALHSLNELRVPLIRDALVSKKSLAQYNIASPLEGFWILDVGSGGGILSEPLARLGASVIGIEASEENIKIAQAHLIHDPKIRDRVKYIQSTVEDIAETQAGKFDAVVASEVLEHVSETQTFVSSACKLVRPGGSIFFTTLNKTRLSYALGIVAAENILRLVAPGTHDWNKFVSPTDLQKLLDDNKFITKLIHGMWYNPISKRWSWSKDTSINYAIYAVKPIVEGNADVWKEQSPLTV